MTNVLFVCGKNRWRSPTAEQLFADYPGIECLSAGLSRDADTPLTGELLEWADLIFAMERVHKTKLSARFREHLGRTRIVCLGIADEYEFMDPALIGLLIKRITPHLT